jgi:putative DNA primase/helicase
MIPPGLAVLKRHRNFILYRTERDAITGKLNKIPLSPVDDPAKWHSYDEACQLAAQRPGVSLGFVLCESVKIAVVDVDGCRDPQTAELSLLAQAIMLLLPGAYAEISISGTGIHLWFSYSGEMPAHACKANGAEFYHDKRFFALGSPSAADGNVETDLTMMLPVLIGTYFPPAHQSATGERQVWTTEPDPDWSGPDDDGELLRRALHSTSAAAAFDPKKPSFSDLWNANAAKLSIAYPGGPNRPYDASSADAALAQHLAWWTGRSCARVERIMLGSALVREKWERGEYLKRTILGAVARQVEVYQGRRPMPATAAPVTGGITLDPVERTLANVGTQDAVALIFTRRMQGKMLYDRTRSMWLEYDGARWKADRLGRAHNLIRDIARELNYDGKASMGAASFCEGVERLLQSAPEFARTTDQFDRDNYLLNTPAGTLDLRTCQMRPHDPSDMLTLCTSVAPDPRGREAFHKFMNEITAGDCQLQAFHQVSLGACLSGAVEVHLMLFWIGTGRNGKNTLGDLVQEAMGDYARKIPSATLMAKSYEGHPTDIANLQGIRLAASSEINEGEFWNEARINEITGDAILSARFMRGDFFTFPRTHKHLIYGNYRPQLRSVSDGIRSRIKIVPFAASFKGHEDVDLPRRLRENLGYVLGWLIEGHRQWLEAGKKLPRCKAVETESESYFANQSTPLLWLAERTERLANDGRPALSLPKVTELYRDYRQWKEARGERAVSQSRWKETMQTERFELVRTNRGMHYRGLRLLPPSWDLPFQPTSSVTGCSFPPPPPPEIVQ